MLTYITHNFENYEKNSFCVWKGVWNLKVHLFDLVMSEKISQVI